MKKLTVILLCLLIFVSAFLGCNPQNPSNSSSSSFETSSSSTSDSSSFLENSSISDSSSSSNTEQGYSVEFLGESEITLEVGDVYNLEWEITGNFEGCINWSASTSCVNVGYDGKVTALKEGVCVVTLNIQEEKDSVTFTVESSDNQPIDPYLNVNKQDFYANYTPATSYQDSYYRTKHNLMSGDISDQDQAPTIEQNRPKEDGNYIKNTSSVYSTDGNTYYVFDVNGEIACEIYKGGAYVTLEEVAAYIFAFNELPANYTSSKKGYPSSDPWGKYLRLNHSSFNGSTTKYPYEPELPNISGCGGSYNYYEVDIGTTGTTAGNYAVAPYNNGSKITRGAARIVYSRFDSGAVIKDFSKKYLFYTYNHYNDFQEYLNYYNGWGEMFGNITGGGVLSSKTNCNPTPYVEVIAKNFTYSTYFANYLN